MINQDLAKTAVAVASQANTGHPNSWRLVFGAMFAMFCWVLFWHWRTAQEVFGIWWRSDTYAHGLIVLPICAWLVWRKRDAVRDQVPAPAASVVVLVGLAGCAWLLGRLVGVNALTHLSLFLILLSALVGLLGWKLARVFAFPFIFLLFGVPIGDFLLPTLMHYTAEFTVFALRLSGVPVYQDGLHFMVPNGRWSVVEACSGVRYLIASLTVGTLYAYLNYQSLSRRLIFVLISAVVPIIANWVRAYMIVMLGYLSDNQIAAGVDHLIYGWLFFGVIIFLMFWIGSRWREDDWVAPQGNETQVLSIQSAPRRWGVVSAIAVTVAIFPLVEVAIHSEVEPFSVSLSAPEAVEGWEQIPVPSEGFYYPDFSGYRGNILARYRRLEDGREVGLYVSYYARQRAGEELVTSTNQLVRGEPMRFSLLRSRLDMAPIGQVRWSSLSGERQRVEIWHWYWANEAIVTSDIRAKIMLALDHLSGRPDDAAFVSVFTYSIEGEQDQARDLVLDFVAAHWNSLEQQLRSTGRGLEAGGD